MEDNLALFLALIILLFIEFEITLNTTWKELFSTHMVKK